MQTQRVMSFASDHRDCLPTAKFIPRPFSCLLQYFYTPLSNLSFDLLMMEFIYFLFYYYCFIYYPWKTVPGPDRSRYYKGVYGITLKLQFLPFCVTLLLIFYCLNSPDSLVLRYFRVGLRSLNHCWIRLFTKLLFFHSSQPSCSLCCFAEFVPLCLHLDVLHL